MCGIAAALPATGGKTVTLVSRPNFGATMSRVTSEVQNAPAFHEGEQPLAVIEDTSVEARAKAQGYGCAMVVTDRRTYGRGHYSNVSEMVFDVFFQNVVSFNADIGLLTGAIYVQLSNAQFKTAIPVMLHQLKALLQGVVTLPPEYRTMGPCTFAPSAGDDFGARAASQHASGEPRALAIFQLADAAARAGRLDAAACTSLLERTIVFDRHAAYGRGAHYGQWLSLLPRAVLREALTALLGAPSWGSSDERGDVIDFPLASRGSGAGLSTALGLASLAVLGVGWIARPGQAPPAFLRFTIVDAPCGSMFQVGSGNPHGVVGRMPLSGARIFAAIHDALVRLEARQLLADAVMSDVPMHERLAQSEAAIAQRARETAQIDLRVFA
jgi:hypothetical protein